MHFPEFPIPFFVADRPMSLELLKYCGIHQQNGFYGIMGHANTTVNFQEQFKLFPKHNIIKMVDSGVFTKEGCSLEYKDLFCTYERMGANYGIMIDFLKDDEKTLESAVLALEEYQKYPYSFNLVGVAQGNNVNEYLNCFRELKEMGFDFVAIGGLLEKQINSARYVHVKDEKFLKNVLEKIKTEYSNDWIFTLGCYHPKRHKLLKEYGVFGADYKGWIFNYKTPKEILKQKNRELQVYEKDLNIENSKLSSFIKTRDNLERKFNSKINKDEKRRLESKLRQLDEGIMLIRKDISENLNDEEYSFSLYNFEKFLTMDTESKRTYRFNQIKGYLHRNVFSKFKENLLIISCSQSKTTIPNPAPAIKIYDGPLYRILKKTDKKVMDNLHVMIISAKYGIISLYDPIEKYDKKMTRRRAKELNKPLKKELTEFLENNEFEKVFINLGKDYKLAIAGTDFKKPIEEAEGKIGQKLSITKKWLNS